MKLSNPLTTVLLRQKPVFRLMVATAPVSVPVAALETDDPEFIKRVEKAMNQAASAARGERVV